MYTFIKGALLLAFAVPAHGTQHCPKTFTVAMDQRAARAIYAGTRPVSRRQLRLLGRLEMCQRHRADRAAVRDYNHHQRQLWLGRRIPPVPAGWAIPWPVVNCESGGNNDPPNSAGASGYYQIIPSTWLAYGGGAYASQAYLASKAAQGVVAARIWDSPGGPQQWTCAFMTHYA